jgi:hypothetical protein
LTDAQLGIAIQKKPLDPAKEALLRRNAFIAISLNSSDGLKRLFRIRCLSRSHRTTEQTIVAFHDDRHGEISGFAWGRENFTRPASRGR